MELRHVAGDHLTHDLAENSVQTAISEISYFLLASRTLKALVPGILVTISLLVQKRACALSYFVLVTCV